ncbi:hypothetical protein EPJ69_07295 [Brachyspira aalborgi]|uniref:Uncharacterized protein n=1 Tax=Brachyspira aalborgi TaxID=29522 RepID=A0A5C8E3Y1_9SPIR|nr:hypothetical protein [Brachyspira aalborgi]TXJ31431.1 hypothetical protein EPJ69_07295 [Brachyspira aalborgi]
MLFSISCSNEDTTGGDTGYNYNYFSVSEKFGNSKDITLATSTVSATGTVGFNIYGSTSYSVSIERVDSGSNPLTLDANDFSYTESTAELTLSYSGLTKYQAATLNARQKYQYTITFKFTDYISEDTKNVDVTVNLIKAQMITKKDIENMMKSVKNSDGMYGSENNGEIVFFDGGTTTFDFKSATFSGSTPNFSATGTTITTSGSVTHTASRKTFSLANAIAGTTQYKTYFSSSVFDIDYDSTPPTIRANNKTCTFTLKFKKLQSGYALSSEVSRLATTGLTIGFTLTDKASWK